MNFFGKTERRYTGEMAEKKMLYTEEAQRLQKFLQGHPQDVGDKEVRNIESFAAWLRETIKTKIQKREVGDKLRVDGFPNLSSNEGLDFIRKNY